MGAGVGECEAEVGENEAEVGEYGGRSWRRREQELESKGAEVVV